jgi:hypothetical protein
MTSTLFNVACAESDCILAFTHQYLSAVQGQGELAQSSFQALSSKYHHISLLYVDTHHLITLQSQFQLQDVDGGTKLITLS